MKTIIYGAGGHGLVLLDIAEESGLRIDYFVDDRPLNDIQGVKVISPTKLETIGEFIFVVGIGHNQTRARLYSHFIRLTTAFNLVHPFSAVSKRATLGKGVVVAPGAVVNTGARIGDNVILNTGCSVDHECVIEANCHICPGVHLAGNVSVGAGTMIGTGTSVIPGIQIGSNSVIGAGSAVVRDIPSNCTAFGSPAEIKTKAISNSRFKAPLLVMELPEWQRIGAGQELALIK
jgi:sugar O-acyltransferase (sialic acid O-acetyltransferase NeuD family)